MLDRKEYFTADKWAMLLSSRVSENSSTFWLVAGVLIVYFCFWNTKAEEKKKEVEREEQYRERWS